MDQIDSFRPVEILGHLPDLRVKLARARREMTELSRVIQELETLIEMMERIKAASPERRPPQPDVSPDSFRRMTVPQALRRVMLTNDRAYRTGELMETLRVGGHPYADDKAKIRQNISSIMKDWRAKRWLVQGEEDPHSWQLTALGRKRLEAIEQRQSAQRADAATEDDAPLLKVMRGEGG